MRVGALFLLGIAVSTPASSGTIDLSVRSSRGTTVRNAVVYAVPVGRELGLSRRTAEMDQRNRIFIPHVLVVQTGTAVRFPNRDDIYHHVYSFSPAKSFQLPLYKGTPANPVVFDRAGVAMLGCNIHDRMSAYIVVVDTPWFAKSDNSGRALISDIDPGTYTVRVWYPDIGDEPEPLRVTVNGNGLPVRLSYVAGARAITSLSPRE